MALQEKYVKFSLEFKNLTLEICIATNNSHKTEEIIPLIGKKFKLLTLKLAGIHEELPENQNTLEGNAEEKADFVFNKLGIACFADDTGLEVESLQGAPGVYSARYAGPQRSDGDNIQLLLKNLEGYSNRNARFRTVICWISPKGKLFFEGILEGHIALSKSGTSGFGYDPIFIPKGQQRSLAEISLTEKNQISHRAKAVEKLVSFLKDFHP
jgi:XTP/dITP diphosphohydrolase